MISPLRYPGGKAKLFKFFSELIRLNGFYGYSYCEPYAGGAGLALKLLSHGFIGHVEINDIDPAIAAFWRSILTNTERFCERIANVELSVDEWYTQRRIYNESRYQDEFCLGFAAYYLNRTSRSGIIEGSGPIGGYEQQSRWTIDARFNRNAQIGHVMEISRFKDAICVSQMDAIDFVKSRITRDKTLIYLDPPYYVKGRKLYKNFYEHCDHVCISQALTEWSDEAWVLSYDYAAEIMSLYPSFEPLIYDLQYSAGQAGHGKEVIFAGKSVNLPGVEFLRKVA